MKYQDALTVAETLRDMFAGACERIEIAGSIRRRKDLVKDIELVAVPKWHEQEHSGVQLGLGETVAPTERVNVLVVAIGAVQEHGAVRVIKPGTQDIEPGELRNDAKYIRLWLPRYELKVDVFVCTPETWGLNFFIRTGSWEFSQAMLARWKSLTGGRSEGAQLRWPDGRIEPTPEELDVFNACRVLWVEPHLRTDAAVLLANRVDAGGAR